MGRVVSMPVNSGAKPASTEVNSPAPALTRGLLEGAIRTAIRRTKFEDGSGLSEKQAAIAMGLDAGLWSKQLSGREGDHIWLDRLVLLPVEFWREFLPLLADPLGMSVDSEDREEAALARALEAFAVVTPLLLRRQRRARQSRLPMEHSA